MTSKTPAGTLKIQSGITVMIPTQSELELPLLRALIQLSGQARARDVYPLVAKQFPDLTDEDLAATLKHGENVFRNRVQWARQRLIDSNDMSSGGHGIWVITDQGRARVNKLPSNSLDNGILELANRIDLKDLHDRYVQSFKRRIRQKLLDAKPTQFEAFARRLLLAYGFEKVEVTRASSDGGIDGFGRLRLGLAALNAAFQCKRWSGNVPREEVDKFRGAIQGQFEQGIFFTTSDFTTGAREASLRQGAVPIILYNGERIVQMMLDKEIGVTKDQLFLLSDEDLVQWLDSDGSDE